MAYTQVLTSKYGTFCVQAKLDRTGRIIDILVLFSGTLVLIKLRYDNVILLQNCQP